MPQSRSPDPAAPWPAWPLRLLALAYFTMGTGTLAVVGALPPIAASLSLPPSAVALMVSAFAATFAVAAPVVQMVAGHLPRRTLLLAGLGILGASTLLSAGVGSYPLLLILRIISGVGAACVGPVVSALGSTLVPPQRQGRALAIVFSGMTMASVVGLPLSAWLGEQIGWRPMFVGLGVWTWGVALAVALGVKDRGRGHALGLGQLAAVLRRPGVAGGVALMVCQMAGLFTTITLINPLLRDRFGADTAQTSLALMVLGLSGLAGNYLARWLADLWSADRLVAISLGGLTVMFLSMAGAPARLWAALALLVLWALANDLFMPSQQRRMVELAPEVRGLVLALNSSALYVGMAAGSFTAGAVEPLAGVGTLPLVSAGFMATGLGLLAATRRAAVASATRTVQSPAACPAAR